MKKVSIHTTGRDRPDMAKVQTSKDLFYTVNKLKLKKEVEFYYTLKKIDSSGFIRKEDLIEKTRRISQDSKPTIYRKIKKLTKLKMVKKTQNGYRVCSYVKFFAVLGLEYDPIFLKTDKSKGILKKSAQMDIKWKIERQCFAALELLEGNPDYECYLEELSRYDFKEIFALLARVFKDHAACIVKGIAQLKDKARNLFNPDITLSLRKLAEFLGFKSHTQALHFLNELESDGLIGIERNRFVEVDYVASYACFLFQYGHTYKKELSKIFKKLPNKYSFF